MDNGTLWDWDGVRLSTSLLATGITCCENSFPFEFASANVAWIQRLVID
jgi:hypothetical protein